MKRSFKTYFLSILSILVLFLANISPVSASPNLNLQTQEDVETTITRGFDYIASQLNSDGGVRWIDETSSVAATIRVVLAMAAAGYPQDFLQSKSGNRPIDFLASSGADWVNQTNAEQPAFSLARAGQTLTALSAANENSRDFGKDNIDLVYAIKANYDPNTGIFGNATTENVTDQVWGILGLAASSAGVPAEAVDWLINAQLEDGSWNDGFESYLDTTPLAIMALLASGHTGRDSPEVLNGLDFIQTNQQPQGGWQTQWDSTTNANTTGVMLQVIQASGQNPNDESWQKEEGNPQTALFALQKENGAIGGDFANTYSTADAIIGLSGQTLFNLGLLRRASQGFNYLTAVQAQDGGWESTGQTIDSLLALSTAGWDPATVTQNGASPLTFIAENLEDYIQAGPDAIGKAMLAVVAAGENAADFAGINLVSRLMDTYNEQTGVFGNPDNTWHQALAILGLKAAQAELPENAVETLVNLQQPDGGWEYSTGFGTSPDTTALAVQALAAVGTPAEVQAITAALDYLKAAQTTSGDWGDSSTTSYVLMALNALRFPHEEWASESGHLPQAALFNYQNPNGSFFFNPTYPDDNLMSTSAALMAVLSGDYLVTAPTVEDVNIAGLVIDPGTDDPSTACVEFNQEIISGLELLDGSDFPYDSQDGFMNSILNISNTEGETNYWSYWQWNGRAWQFKNVGASESTVLPGSIEAWHFTSWEIFPSLPPDTVPNLTEICGADTLKNYTIQPYLNYSDIISSFSITDAQAEPVESEITEEPALTPVQEQTSTETSPPQPTKEPTETTETEQSELSLLPIFIIVGIGFVLVIMAILVLRKTRS